MRDKKITITVAGATGSGKTTVIKHLYEILREAGYEVVLDLGAESEYIIKRRDPSIQDRAWRYVARNAKVKIKEVTTVVDSVVFPEPNK